MAELNKYYVLCNEQIFCDGTEFQCRSYIKKRYKEFPRHQDMELVKFIERVKRNEIL